MLPIEGELLVAMKRALGGAIKNQSVDLWVAGLAAGGAVRTFMRQIPFVGFAGWVGSVRHTYRVRLLTTFSGGEKSSANGPRAFHARRRKGQRD